MLGTGSQCWHIQARTGSADTVLHRAGQFLETAWEQRGRQHSSLHLHAHARSHEHRSHHLQHQGQPASHRVPCSDSNGVILNLLLLACLFLPVWAILTFWATFFSVPCAFWLTLVRAYITPVSPGMTCSLLLGTVANYLFHRSRLVVLALYEG